MNDLALKRFVKEEKVIGFEDDEEEQALLLKKKKKKKMSLTKKPGGFQSMGLSFPILKAIQKRGYIVPTPIQRKTIPVVMEGKDVVAMARTGSGKTAAFLIPMFERLKCRGTLPGIRAIVFSPTRELALQTMRFLKELGRFLKLKFSIVVGGDSMEAQFSDLHTNPDIVIATPGRFLHICVEMELKLNNVEIVIFDEADRLFEMGFGVQLKEIIDRLPNSRQTLLFSATLPKMLVEFAKAGLSDPVLIRLDVEAKLPEALNISFISCRSDEKPAALLCLLKHVVDPFAQVIIFAATKHHVEYLHILLNCAKITNTFIYSDLDPAARKINAAKFQTGQVAALIVTDIAARGIDIPHLDYVINFNFPAKPKLFVHRVGRCARAGRRGWAISLVAPDEMCYALDMFLFLGKPLEIEPPGSKEEADESRLGAIPPSLLEAQLSQILQWELSSSDLVSMKKVSENGYKQYVKCRTGASRESVRRAKDVCHIPVGVHAFFTNINQAPDEAERSKIIADIHTYRPPGNIFEIGQSSHSELYTVMKRKRETHKANIINHKRKEDEAVKEIQAKFRLENKAGSSLEMCNENEDLGSTFSRVISNRRRNLALDDPAAKIKNIDKENYIPYRPTDYHTEVGLAVNSFQREASAVGLDLNADTERGLKSSRTLKVWDKKKKKMVQVEGKRKIKSESGSWIDASYKSGKYQQWVEKTKVHENLDNQEEDDEPQKFSNIAPQNAHTRWANHNNKIKEKKRKSEIKRPEQIVKARMDLERRRQKFGRKKKHRK